MDLKNILKKYRSKLVKEAVIKASFAGAVFGFSALLLYEFIAWMFAAKAVWPGAIVFVVVAGGAGALFYFKKFRPTAKQTAARIDKLGLEERVLTMTELEKENSEIAAMQRADTIKALTSNGISEKLIKIAVSVPMIVALVFSAVCGITTDEMLTQMSAELDGFAEALSISRDEAVSRLKELYDGYHFTWPSPGILNPFSLLNALQDRRLNNYWFASGTPTYLIEMLRKFDVLPSDIGAMDALAEEFDAPTEGMNSIIPLLYQSGYLTIKRWDKDSRLFTLDIPNTEVRTGLMNSLLPLYVQRLSGRGMTMVAKMSVLLKREDLDGALKLLRAFLLTVPYCENTSSEGHYQQMLYIIFSLLAQYDSIDVEVRTPTGRVDMVMRTDRRLYIFELKLNASAETAIAQIDLKDYPSRFALCQLPIVKVGINFNLHSRTIEDWRITNDAP